MVRNLTSFGAFVEIEPGIDGLVHVSDMSWTKRVEHPSEVVQKGQEVEVMVLDVDAENKRISLGIKQLQDDPWPGISERFAPGVESDGKVVRVQDKGVVVDLGDDIEGFVPVSHCGIDDPNRIEEYYGPGDPVDLRVLESDAVNRRIVLEVTSKPERKAQEVIDAARGSAEAEDGEAAEAPTETDEAATEEATSEVEAEAEAEVAEEVEAEAEAEEAEEVEAEAEAEEAEAAPVAEAAAEETTEVEEDAEDAVAEDEAPKAEAEAEHADDAVEAEAEDDEEKDA